MAIRVEGRGMKITKETKKTKKVRVGGPYLDSETYSKIKRLSRCLDTGIPTILEEMAVLLLNNPSWLTYIQDKYGIGSDDIFRIVPILEEGKLKY
ncbi:hypothetical protein [Ammoniphilus sp. CFH 90114]|uniref:hypothetical protein n=1 Tax=Ammoniphilus sp. CFH 90114 TaxID=2493665 RepID=UPI00100EBB00|nr:hypothetical protein [Ammoniphilus sp. CFH 90114]RXT14869.1 hypothetical protein EIZ39_01260 [Ammoniphilus sp. CFH 90114]